MALVTSTSAIYLHRRLVCYEIQKNIVRRTMTMASFHCCARPYSYSALGFHSPSSLAATPFTNAQNLRANALPTATNSRLKNASKLQVRQRYLAVFASNTNPSDSDSIQDKAVGTKTDDDYQGPPFLTILAGLVVFLFICWIIGSIVLWLISLIVSVPPSK